MKLDIKYPNYAPKISLEGQNSFIINLIIYHDLLEILKSLIKLISNNKH